MLPIGNIVSVIGPWNCFSTNRTPDDNHLSNGSRDWTGCVKLRSGSDYELQKSTITSVIDLLFDVACSNAAAYVNEALIEGDEVVFKTAVADVIRACGVGKALIKLVTTREANKPGSNGRVAICIVKKQP